MFRNMDEVKAANAAAGCYFFSGGAKRFFSSHIGRTLYGGRFFLTSEEFVDSDRVGHGRLYTVREALPDGNIETVGEFYKHTRSQAQTVIENLLLDEGAVPTLKK